MLCGPVSYLIGRRSKKMRDRFIVLTTLLELLATVAVVAGEHLSPVWTASAVLVSALSPAVSTP